MKNDEFTAGLRPPAKPAAEDARSRSAKNEETEALNSGPVSKKEESILSAAADKEKRETASLTAAPVKEDLLAKEPAAKQIGAVLKQTPAAVSEAEHAAQDLPADQETVPAEPVLPLNAVEQEPQLIAESGQENEDDFDSDESEEDEADEEEDEDEDAAEAGPEDLDDLEFVQDDPLAPAYDLEKGQLFEKHQSTALPWRSDIRSAKEFFNTELLYRYDILEDEEQQRLYGRYRIELKGYQGGVWTIEIGDDFKVVNRKEDAEMTIVMQQRDFIQLVNGRLNPQLAILGQKMRILGDVKRCVWFQSLLYPNFD